MGFYIFQNLNKFYEFQMPLKALGKIILEGVKQTLKSINHQ
jgi:hypothetical protein